MSTTVKHNKKEVKTKEPFKSTNKEEYLFLREEIMYIMGLQNDFAKRATTMFVSVFTGCILIIGYPVVQDLDMINFDKSLSSCCLTVPVASILMLMLLFFFYTLSLKIKGGKFDIYKISEYLIKIHEKPIHENDGSSFFWETAGREYSKEFHKKKERTPFTVWYSYREIFLLSLLTLIIFLGFCVGALCFLHYYGSGLIIKTAWIFFIIIGVLGIWLRWEIKENLKSSGGQARKECSDTWKECSNVFVPHTDGQ